MRKSATIIEIMATVIILAIIAGISVHPLMKFYDLWWYNTSHMQLLWGARGAMYDMTKNIRMINGEVYTATASTFEFDIEDAGGSTVRVVYQLSGGVLYKNANELMDDVSSLTFTYYDEDGNVIGSPAVSPNETDIREVEVEMTVATDRESLDIATMVLCRNLIDL